MLIPSLPSMSSLIRTGGPDISTEERHVWAHDVVDSHKHLLGQHTVKLSPISYVTALSLVLFRPHSKPLHCALEVRLASIPPSSPSASHHHITKSLSRSSSTTLIQTQSHTRSPLSVTNLLQKLSPFSQRSSPRSSSGGGTTSTTPP